MPTIVTGLVVASPQFTVPVNVASSAPAGSLKVPLMENGVLVLSTATVGVKVVGAFTVGATLLTVTACAALVPTTLSVLVTFTVTL